MTVRRALSRLARVRIFDRHHGICHLCGVKIKIGEIWEASHIVSLWAGGADTEENLGPAHVDCHRGHTSTESPIKAKTDRQRANYLGIRKPSRFPTARTSRWKKKMDGTVVARMK